MKICFIVASQNKSTILDRIAHEIGNFFDEPIYHYATVLPGLLESIPKADHYFVTHYSMLNNVMMQVNPGITPVTCFFTHDKGGLPQYVESFNLCHSVIAESLEGMELLESVGVKKSLLHFVPEGGDNESFKPHSRTQEGSILVCGTNYADGRKNPEMIKAVYELCESRKFIFLGTGWRNSIPQISDRAEFIDNIPYEEYPEVYKQCSVYLSCSKLEGGGPNSLIEAMHSNLVPIVSNTGNACNYIIDGYNGFIFEKDYSAEQISNLIEEAYKLSPQNQVPYNDIWQTVRDFTWKGYGLQIKEIITGDYSTTCKQGEFGELPKTEEEEPYPPYLSK